MDLCPMKDRLEWPKGSAVEILDQIGVKGAGVGKIDWTPS